MLCILSTHVSANKNKIEVKYYLWTGIDEGTGKLLVDYEYNTIVALKKNVLRCRWNLEYYYSIEYYDGFPFKMYTYSTKMHKIIKTDIFNKGILQKTEITEGPVCTQSYQDYEDKRVISRKCSDNSSSIQYFKRSKNNIFLLQNIDYYKDRRKIKTLIVDPSTEKYEIANVKNEIIKKGRYLNANRTRDILPVCIDRIDSKPSLQPKLQKSFIEIGKR